MPAYWNSTLLEANNTALMSEGFILSQLNKYASELATACAIGDKFEAELSRKYVAEYFLALKIKRTGQKMAAKVWFK